ncbi:MAG: hypothetical protein HOQ22_05300, partial [Nocardioidaceae bacterium]|nr:hypothetical protein [Nocardioidaceae bacterium]
TLADDVAISGPSAAGPTVPPADVVDLDRGPVGDASVTACLTPGFATSADQVEVRYARTQATDTGTAAVLVLRNRAGDLRLCDAYGADAPAVAPVPVATDAEPVVFLSTGRATWSCRGADRVLESFRSSTWLAVAPAVRTVQQRFWVGDVPGPWFRTRARDGYAHLQTWLTGPEPAGTRFAVQYRVLGADGADVPQHALPTGRRALPGCGSGGSAEIG